MKRIIALIATLALSGCVTNGEIDYGKTALLVGTIAVGIALASQNESAGGQNCHWVVTAGGSTQVCK